LLEVAEGFREGIPFATPYSTARVKRKSALVGSCGFAARRKINLFRRMTETNSTSR